VRSPTEFAIILQREYASLPQVLTDHGGLIAGSATSEKFPDTDAADATIGAGPYKLKENRQGVAVSFVPNEHYWNADEGAELEQITLTVIKDQTSRSNARKSGQTDGAFRMSHNELKVFEGDDDFQVCTGPTLGMAVGYLNKDKPQL